MTTVRQAAQLLATRCDGARALDGQGFNKLDAPFIRDLLAKQRWTPKMERAIQKVLTKYKGQLANAGIDHSTLDRETHDEATNVNFAKQAMELNCDDQGRLLLKSPFSFREQAKAIQNHKWVPELKMWRYLPKIEVYVALQPYLQSGDIVPDAAAQLVLASLAQKRDEELKRLASHDKNVVKATKIKEAEEIDVDVPLKTVPMSHQKKAFAIGTTLDAAAFLMEQGTGKTLSAIAVAGHRFMVEHVTQCIVVAPLSVVPVWQAEFDKHADFPCMIVSAQTKDIKKVNKIDDLFGANLVPRLKVLVVNYETLWRIMDQLKAWLRSGSIAILDESQKIKNGQSKQSKAAHALGKLCKYRLILTGTPVTQSPMDVHSQYRFLNPDIFGQSFTQFRSRYAIMGGYGGYEVVGYKDLADLSTRAHSIAYRVTKAEALDLPPMTDQILYCELDESAKAYRSMEKDMMVTIGGDQVTTPIVLTQLLRLQQITGGFLPVKDEDTEELKHVASVGTEKLKLLRELIEDMPKGKKLVIFARFIPEIKAIQQLLTELDMSSRTLTGDTDAKLRGKMVAHFQSPGSGQQVLIIQIQTGGLGITLTAADTAIFYSTSFSFADYEQARARIHRIGQKQPVTYIHLIARGTIDEQIMLALKEKRNIAELVVDNLNPVKRSTYVAERRRRKGDSGHTGQGA